MSDETPDTKDTNTADDASSESDSDSASDSRSKKDAKMFKEFQGDKAFPDALSELFEDSAEDQRRVLSERAERNLEDL